MSRVFILALIICMGICVASCVTSEKFPEKITPMNESNGIIQDGSNGTLARGYLTYLSNEIGPRVSGSSKEEEGAQYVYSIFSQSGYSPQIQKFSFETEDGKTKNSSNIIVEKPGKSKKVVILGAHYDTVDNGDGADDNSGGVATMLEVAQRLKDVNTGYTLRFIAFGAEENLLDGSRYYVDQMNQTEIANIEGMINLDSIIVGDTYYLLGDEGVRIRDALYNNAVKQEYILETVPVSEFTNSDENSCEYCADHVPFQEAGIPFAYLAGANWNLGDEEGFGDIGEVRHSKYDTLQYLDKLFPGLIDERLNATVRILTDTLTQFGEE